MEIYLPRTSQFSEEPYAARQVAERLMRSLHRAYALACGFTVVGFPRLTPEFNELAWEQFKNQLSGSVESVGLELSARRADAFARDYAEKFNARPEHFLTSLRSALEGKTPEECRAAWKAFFQFVDARLATADTHTIRMTELILPIILVLMHDPVVHAQPRIAHPEEVVYQAVERRLNLNRTAARKAIRRVLDMLRVSFTSGDIVGHAAHNAMNVRRQADWRPVPSDAIIYAGIENDIDIATR